MQRLNLTLIAAPAVPLYSIDDVKVAIKRTDIDDDDGHIQRLIDVVTAKLDGPDGDLGRALINQTWAEELDEFPISERFWFVLAPVSSIVSVEYFDLDNQLQTFDAANYSRHNGILHSYIRLAPTASWPSTFDRDDAVKVTYVAGYGPAASNVPKQILQAGHLLIGHYDRFRQTHVAGTITEVPNGYMALIRNFKRPIFSNQYHPN